MRAIYRVLALLVPIIVAFQAFAMAMVVFGLGSWVDDGHDFTKSVLESDNSPVTGSVGDQLHGYGAMAMALVALLLLVVSFFSRFQGARKWALIVFVDTILQWLFAFAGFIVSWQIGAVHGLNALVLAGLGMAAYTNAKRAADVTVQAPRSPTVV